MFAFPGGWRVRFHCMALHVPYLSLAVRNKPPPLGPAVHGHVRNLSHVVHVLHPGPLHVALQCSSLNHLVTALLCMYVCAIRIVFRFLSRTPACALQRSTSNHDITSTQPCCACLCVHLCCVVRNLCQGSLHVPPQCSTSTQ